MTAGEGPRTVTFEEELDRYGQLVYTGEGDSMLPMLRGKRDLLIIAKRPVDAVGQPVRLKKYDVVLYKRGGTYITHRIVKVLPADGKRPRRLTRRGLRPVTGDYVIAGDHNPFREYDIREEQILGVLTAFVRDGREISVADRRYRLYVHLWCGCFPLRAAVLRVRGKLRALLRPAR